MAKHLSEYERREAIKALLRRKPGATATEVARGVPGEYPTVVASLKWLIKAGRVYVKREIGSKTRYHYAQPEPTG